MMPNTPSSPSRILIHPSSETATSLYRCVAPAAALRMAGHAVTIGRTRFLAADELKTANPDSVILQGQYTDEQLKAIKLYRKTLPKVHLSYDLDDALWLTLESNPASREIPKNVKSRIKTAISMVDTVTVTTEQLAKTIRDAFKVKDVRVIPNHLTSRFIHEAEAGRRAESPSHHTKPRVGWSGSISHVDDLAFMNEIIAHFGTRIQWVFQGLLPASHPNIEFHEFVSLADYPKALGSLHLDLALAPLTDEPFNHNKSSLKLLEYGACGYAVLADKIAPYTGFPHIWHADTHTPAAWIKAIEALIQNPTGLEAIGGRLNAYVKEYYLLNDHLLDWQMAWLPKNTVPFIPRTGSANRLILRDRSYGAANLQARLEQHLGNGASVSVLHNEGVYPIPGSYALIPEDLAARIDEAADFAGCEPVPAPYPTGPAVLLSGSALDRIGEPDVARYGTIDAALLDWGARALEAGMGHGIAADVFVASAEPVARNPEVAQNIVNEVAFWTPFFPQAVSGYAEADPLAHVRRCVEMSFIRREYTDNDEGELKTRLLLINGTEDDVKTAVADNLIFCAKVDGHHLHFTFPQMPNVPPIDTREPIDAFIETLGRLALPHIAFKGIGDGTLGVVGFLADVAEAGWRVDAMMPETIDSRHRVSEEQWQATWDRLLQHQKTEEESDA